MGLKKYMLFLLLQLFIVAAIANASWQGPQIVILGGWGNQLDQFGIEYGDSGDTFPRDIIVLSDGDIWIPDGLVNERLKLYDSSGNLKKIIALDKTTRTFPEYWFIGKFAGYGSDGSIYMVHYMGKDQYAKYSPTGQLIKTFTTKPAELGIVRENRMPDDRFMIRVQYPDKTYNLSARGSFVKYIRDVQGNMYGVNPGGAWRFNQCGKEVGELLMPKAQQELMPVQNMPVQQLSVEAEYGEPVVAPNGDVYTWKKTPFKYSILKWTWVDDPNVPSGPDAPMGLTLMPSTTGLYLTWTASPSDPGCVTGYEVARATSAGGVLTTVATVDKGVVKYNDTTASVGTTYYYKIRAVAGSEFSPYTSEVSGKR